MQWECNVSDSGCCACDLLLVSLEQMEESNVSQPCQVPFYFHPVSSLVHVFWTLILRDENGNSLGSSKKLKDSSRSRDLAIL